MEEFLLELYSEEIPPKLQTNARNNLSGNLRKLLDENKIKYKNFETYSSPTRIVVHISNLPKKIIIPEIEIRGPKIEVSEEILESFIKSHDVTRSEVFKKKTDKGNFISLKKIRREIFRKYFFNKFT